MLTVKHIDTDGTERIMQADFIEVVRKGLLFEDGIFLDPEDASNSIAGDLGNQLAVPEKRRGFKHVIHFAEARSTNDTPPVVFVMNRFGATVAKYDL
jgi:hypothetical protein